MATCRRTTSQAHQGRDRRLGGRRRHGDPCPGDLALEAVLRRLDRLRRRAEQPGLAGRRGDAGHAAGDQRGMRRAGGAHRARPEGADQPALGVRPEELLLSRPAAGLPDLAVQAPDRRRGRGRWSTSRPTEQIRGRHRAAASRAGRRQVAARPVADDELRRPQPLRRRADGDRLEARHALGRRGQGLCDASCAPSCATSAPATATWRRATCAPTSTSRCAGPASRSARAARSRTSTRSASSARRSTPRRAARSAILEDGGTIDQETRLFDPGTRRDALDALQGGGARLPLLPRSRPAAARIRRGLRRRARGRPAGTAGRQEGALHRATTACRPTTPACSSPNARPPTITRRAVAHRRRQARRQGGRQLDHGRPRRLRQRAGLSRRRDRISAPRADRRRSSTSSATARSPARSPRTCSRCCIGDEQGRRSARASSKRAA